MYSSKYSHLTAPTKKSGAALIILIGYLLSLALEGPLRLLLAAGHIETLLYSRDVLAFAVVLIKSTTTDRPSSRQWNITSIFLYAIICHSIFGLWVGHPISSILFSIKIFISLMFGFACAPLLRTRKEIFVRLIFFIFTSCCIGVYFNTIYGFLPWEGAEFESAFGTSVNRLWWAGGERRLPGFGRASTTTAAAIGITGIFITSFVNKWKYKVLTLAFGVPAIYLTTSKGALLSFLVVGIWCFVKKGQIRAKSGLALLWTTVILCTAAPLAAAFFKPEPSLIRAVPRFLSSFADRAAQTWPTAFDHISGIHLALLGQGIGGAGSPLKFGHEYVNFNPIDNLFLYLYLTFGMFGIIYYIFSAIQISKIAREADDFSLGLFAIGIHIFCYGITAHQIEDAFESIWIGMLVAYIPLLKRGYQR